MPLHNFLRVGTRAPLQTADVVFQITEITPSGHEPRRVGHAGLVAAPKIEHGLGEEVVVYHMADLIRRDRWDDGLPRGSRADVAGTTASLEEGDRRRIVDQALRFFQRRPSMLDQTHRARCYWVGKPDPERHPLHPSAQDAYAFSCATFVHHCYSAVDAPLVPQDELPLLRPEERQLFEDAGWGAHVAPDPVRRLSCSHMICAFEAHPEMFPFRPSDGDWEACADGPTFRRLVGAIAEPG
jgi:hypothetical protein